MYEPYIGITDFTCPEEVKAMLEVFNKYKSRRSTRRLMVGVMMSRKTLHNLPTKWASAFPPKEKISEIFSFDDAYNCLHYADFERPYSDITFDLTLAIGYGGTGIHALQLDMVWPDPAQVANALHMSRKKIEVILQVNSLALEEVGNSPQALVDKLEEYQGVVHRVLLDKSMGRGVGMNSLELRPYVQAVFDRTPWLGIGVAGGLGPSTIYRVAELAIDYPMLSIDAQGQLRPSGNALDPIDWSMAAKYLHNALDLFD